MNLKKSNIRVMQAAVYMIGITMIAMICLASMSFKTPTREAIETFASALVHIGLIILPFSILIYLCGHFATENQIKYKITPIILILFSGTLFSVSSSYLRFYPIGPEYKKSKYERIIGIPAFVTVEEKTVPYYTRTNVETVVEVNHKNLILIFAILSIPIFIAGYMWGNKKNIPNQELEPTSLDAD